MNASALCGGVLNEVRRIIFMKIHQIQTWLGFLVISLSFSEGVQASLSKIVDLSGVVSEKQLECTLSEIEAAQGLAKTVQFEQLLGVEGFDALGSSYGDTSKCSGLTQYERNMNWATCARAFCVCEKNPKGKSCKSAKEPWVICGIKIAPSTISSCESKGCGTDWQQVSYTCN